jgi:hypothetical protein
MNAGTFVVWYTPLQSTTFRPNYTHLYIIQKCLLFFNFRLFAMQTRPPHEIPLHMICQLAATHLTEDSKHPNLGETHA